MVVRVVTCKLRNSRRRDLARLDAVLDLCRVLYNAALQERVDAWRKAHKSLSFYDQSKSLTTVRADDPAYAVLDATMTRMTVLRRLDLAFKGFFRRVKAGLTPGFPRYKGKGRFDTLVFGDRGWKVQDRKLVLKGIGWFRLTSGPHKVGKPKGLHLVQKLGRWYAHIVYEFPTPVRVEPQTSVGIDVGLKTFATLSDGTTVGHPKFLARGLEVLASAERALSRKKKGSNGRRKARAALAHIHAKIANRRRDFLHNTSRIIVDRFDLIAVEKLNVIAMSRGLKNLRRSITDSAWSTFIRMLSYKAECAGRAVISVNPKGTSTRCSDCGTHVPKTLAERVHTCPTCGLVMDRDLNAARNIHDLGWRLVSGAQRPHGVSA